MSTKLSNLVSSLSLTCREGVLDFLWCPSGWSSCCSDTVLVYSTAWAPVPASSSKTGQGALTGGGSRTQSDEHPSGQSILHTAYLHNPNSHIITMTVWICPYNILNKVILRTDYLTMCCWKPLMRLCSQRLWLIWQDCGAGNLLGRPGAMLPLRYCFHNFPNANSYLVFY